MHSIDRFLISFKTDTDKTISSDAMLPNRGMCANLVILIRVNYSSTVTIDFFVFNEPVIEPVEADLGPANIGLFSAMAPSVGSDCLEWSHSDSHAPEWGSLLMMMMISFLALPRRKSNF